MRVLLTGASGFIGRQCIPALKARGFEVYGVSSQPRSGEGIEWRQANLLDPVQTSEVMASVKPTHLLHMAWIATPGVYWTSLDNGRWLAASVRLLQEFHQVGGQRVVMAGTSAEYEWASDVYSDLTTSLRPSTLYGTCKDALQRTVRSFCSQARISGAWGRVFLTFGPHEHPERLVPSVAGRLILGRPAPCSHGLQVRDFMSVEDVADAFAALLASEVVGPVNIASGMGLSIREVVMHIARRLDAERLVRLGERPAASGEPASIVADVTRLRDEVGWQSGSDLWLRLDAAVHWWIAEIRSGRISSQEFTG